MGRRKKVVEVEQEPDDLEDIVIEGDPVIPEIKGSTPDGPRFIVYLQHETKSNTHQGILETENYKEAKEFALDAVIEFNRVVSINDRAGAREFKIDPIKGEEIETSEDGLVKKKPYIRN